MKDVFFLPSNFFTGFANIAIIICYHQAVSVEFKQTLNYRNCLTVIGGMTDNKFILMTDVALDSRLLWFESTTTENAEN